MSDQPDQTPTSEADPLATEGDNGETVPDPSADDPIDEARRRAEELEATADDPSTEPPPRPAPHSR